MSEGFAPPTSDSVGAVGGTNEPRDVSGDKRKKVVPAADTSTTTVSNTDRENERPNDARQENPNELGAVGGAQSEPVYSIAKTKTQLAIKRAHEVDNEEKNNIASKGTSGIADGTHKPASGIIDDDSDTTGSKNYKEESFNCLRGKKKDVFVDIHESEVRDLEKPTIYRPTVDNEGSRFIKDLDRPPSDDSQYQHAICTSLTTKITHMMIEEKHNNINVVLKTESKDNETVNEDETEEHDQVAEPMHRTETRNDQNAETSDRKE